MYIVIFRHCPQALDWFKPLASQRSPVDVAAVEVVLAAECAWLAELVEPFVSTLVGLLSAPHAPVCVFAFRERANGTLYVSTYRYIYISIYIYLNLSISIFSNIYLHLLISIYLFIYLCIYLYLCRY